MDFGRYFLLAYYCNVHGLFEINKTHFGKRIVMIKAYLLSTQRDEKESFGKVMRIVHLKNYH